MAKRRLFKSINKQSGGYLIGPSHEDGGIIATTPGMPEVELEGGEYIINAATTEALGIEFLDKLNRTASPYHSRPGFGRGQLPGSNYKSGGKIKKLQYGGRSSQNRQQIKGALPSSYRKSNVVRAFCRNCVNFRSNYCINWKSGVDKNYICDSWDADIFIKTKQRGEL